MQVRIVDDERILSGCDITVDIKFGQKRKGWTKVRLISIPPSENSCPGCVIRRICHGSPICSEIITEIIRKGYLLPNLQHYRICRV